ncbi:hypothetical protein KTT_57910 [Tengunoibacter tsumagoiensis]|uniref:NodB homology domain-containing protein n=1 Tax=Tengunoibacter tsumagoiensis TaxID=2014871 RepID=A0A402A9U5_9CHLR|nr:hypothetical protein KTT_57910 [Tengunoibacter tsumagoiensis]
MQPQVIAQGRSDQSKIALTFDDGPYPQNTGQILDVLSLHRVHATFFVEGSEAQANPGLVRRELAAGHTVGNHSWNHPELTRLSPEQIDSQLSRANAAITRADGVTPQLMRPPYGSVNDQVKERIAAQHMTTVLWDIDTVDWKLPGVDAITNEAISKAHNGAIILMHDGGGDRSQTIQALPKIIEGLQAKGYQLVTVSELIASLS